LDKRRAQLDQLDTVVINASKDSAVYKMDEFEKTLGEIEKQKEKIANVNQSLELFANQTNQIEKNQIEVI
jgi:hypothetical protein